MNATAIGYGIAGLIALGAGGYILHCEHVKRDREQFIAQLKADAEAQRRGIEEKINRDQQAKEKADAQYLKDRSALQRTISRLRDDRARASSVPAAPADSSRPELASFDRAEFTRAVGNFEAGVEGLIGEGAEATIGLDVARSWAAESF